jgi:hypothetical protein
LNQTKKKTMSRFDTVVLASRSNLKFKALSEWNESSGVSKAVNKSSQDAVTSFAQPASYASAVKCMSERIAQCERVTSERVTIVAIENFIEKQDGGAWVDVCAVAAFYVDKGGRWMMETKRGPTQIAVPPEYAPTGAVLPGYETTVGSRVSAAIPGASAQDWFQSVDAANVSRAEQIKGALACLSFPDAET